MLEILYKMQPLDYVYLLVGIILFIFAIQSFLDKEHKYRIGTGLFWLLYSISFIFGSYLSKEINGWLVIAMAAIVLVKQLGKGHYFESPIEFKKRRSCSYWQCYLCTSITCWYYYILHWFLY